VLARHFPAVQAEVIDAATGFAPCDVLVATGWPSAYTVRSADVVAHRAYLVQDFEPWFYPSGSNSALAAATYGFGFHGITAGRWLANELSREYGMDCAHFEFGVDQGYSLEEPPAERNGVVFYARPNTPRRAFELGVMALTGVAERFPDLTIHLFGAQIRQPLPFRYVDHGVVSGRDLGAIYNRCQAGLVLSMSNLSLVPLELLACGTIPVVNDAPHNRGVVDNEWIRWTPAEPVALREAISAVVKEASSETPLKAAASVRGLGWDSAGISVEESLLRIVREGRCRP
jgi:glycosyltransferase involved in cell wall biosynthesis